MYWRVPQPSGLTGRSTQAWNEETLVLPLRVALAVSP